MAEAGLDGGFHGLDFGGLQAPVVGGRQAMDDEGEDGGGGADQADADNTVVATDRWRYEERGGFLDGRADSWPSGARWHRGRRSTALTAS